MLRDCHPGSNVGHYFFYEAAVVIMACASSRSALALRSCCCSRLSMRALMVAASIAGVVFTSDLLLA